MSDHERAAALNEVLKLALAHPNLLLPEPFEELAAILRRHVGFGRFAVLVPEGDMKRLYASALAGGAAVVPFGARVPQPRALEAAVYERGEAYFCDDMREGDAVERSMAEAGFRSYVIVPVRGAPPARRVLAELTFAFVGVGEARGADLELLQAVGDVVGTSFARSLTTQRERRLATIVEMSTDAMLAWDRERRVTDANPAALTMTGLSREALLGTPVDELLDPISRDEGRMRLHTRAGSVIVSVSTSDLAGDPQVSSYALLRDVSRVVAAERDAATRLARIRELEEQHSTLLDNAPVIIFRLAPRTSELEYLNRQAERLFGVPLDVALGTPGFLRDAHVDPEGAAAFDAAVTRARAGEGPVSYEARLLRAHGDAITARGTVYPLLGEHGELVAIEGVLADVSAEHAARARLVQNDRFAMLGMLAAGVAHEINNPAAFILLGLDMLDRSLRTALDPSAGASARALVVEFREAITRVVDIARDLRVLASPAAAGAAQRGLVDVNRTLESALSLTRAQLIERAELVRHLEDIPPVLVDEGRMGQVAVNLLLHAAQSVARRDARGHAITVATRSDGQVVEIEIADTGAGFTEESLARIWEPLFNTQGAGLGLSISKDIVEHAGGTIRVDSPIYGSFGARFVVTLPAAGELAGAPRSTDAPRAAARRLRVLIVEDETSLAKALGEELSRTHDVAIADGAASALERLANERFDAVLCDLRMPGINGRQLYQIAVERDPRLAKAFVFMTGVSFGADVQEFVASTRRPVLQKPFTARAALEAIARVATS